MHTPEQVKADDALTEAIIANRLAYGATADDYVTDYIVVWSAVIAADDEGTRYGTILRDHNQPYHCSMGLLHTGLELVGTFHEDD